MSMVVGVTGCPGSGKSVLARSIGACGWELIDADGLGRDVVAETPGIVDRLAKEFGDDIIAGDGALERRLLAERAFADGDSIRRLNAIVHPPLVERVTGRIADAGEGRRHAVVDCALIFEWEIAGWFDLVICVSADSEIRRRRLMERDGRSGREIEGMFAAQLSQDDKIRRSDLMIRNEGKPERLKAFGTVLAGLPNHL